MGDIMTGVAKGWDVEKSMTCKRKLVQIIREQQYGRYHQIGNKYTEKGCAAEQDGITLYSRFTQTLFKKNSERLSNDYFTGELDLFEGESITNAEHTHDIKCSWNLSTFPAFFDSVDNDYFYQGQVYMDLSGAKKHTVAHCLVNTPAKLIDDEKRRLGWKYGIIDEETPEYIEACQELERNSIFDFTLFREQNPYYQFHSTKFPVDIPFRERVIVNTIERDDKVIELMRHRVKACRSWIEQNYSRIIPHSLNT